VGLREVYERAIADNESLQLLEHPSTGRRNEAVSRSGHVNKIVAAIVANDDGIQTMRTRSESPDHELLPEVYAMLGVALGADSEIHMCAWEDLAAITIPDSLAVGDLADIRNEWADPQEGSVVGCIGFPVDHNVTVDHRKVGDKDEVGLGLLPVLLDIDVLPQPSSDDLKFKTPGHDEAHHYLVTYSSVMSKQPHGMSGAAIWMPDIKGIVWSPSFRFAGTAISVYMKGYKAHQGPVVQVVKASVVRHFLEEKFGSTGMK
jgi:hypothetical protein